MGVKLSLAHLTALNVSPPDLVSLAAETGYDHASLRLTAVTPGDAFPILTDKAMLRETKARIAATGVGVLDVEVARLTPEAEPESFLPMLETAAELGAKKLADLITANAERLAVIEQRDNGKLAVEVVAQVRYMADYFRYYAGLADKVQSRSSRPTRRACSPTPSTRPRASSAIITPWNSPLTLTSWKLAPALAAGCTAVVKPSEFTSGSMVEFAKLFAEAGFPKGVVNVVTGLGPKVGEALVTAPEGAAHRLHRRHEAGRRSTRWRRAT
jgi:acyl-CoA reductase-like NAD-dependent aldehyde dehydrogenase